MTDVINEELENQSLPEEEEEIVVTDSGTSYVSEESARKAAQSAKEAKLWAEESERQAGLSSSSANTAVEARDDAIAAKEYAEAAITDTNMITVATDLQSTPSNIKTVATNISNVNTVAGVSSDVTTVAGISSNVTTVAGISSNVTTVATSISNVNKVGNDISNVNDVADDLTNIDNVAGDLTNIDTVAGVSSEVSTVAGISNNVTTVAGISSNVYAVAGNASNINAVAGNNANITAVAGNATNINAVNANKTNIDTVAGDKAKIDTVAGISTAVSTVADNDTNITTVATNISDISTTATNISAINTNAENITDIQNASANAQLAKDWATKIDGMIDEEDYSAKYYADRARQAASGAVVDGKSITRNSSDELQTVGVINQNDTTTAVKTWTGTKTQYNNIQSKDANTQYMITDTGEIYLGSTLLSNYGADTSLSNLTSTGKNIANWSNNVTNCITEIPQDIKLELNDGTLTLKAGSKVYVPDGFENDGTTPKFDEVVIESDLTTITNGASQMFLHINIYGSLFAGYMTGGTVSEMPSSPIRYASYYNTSANTCEYYNGSYWDKISLPIAIVTRTGSSGFSSIDQIFNGFGYIGSTIFALPGVEGLIPNGRNADGSLKNSKYTIISVIQKTIANVSSKLVSFFTTGSRVETMLYWLPNGDEKKIYSVWYDEDKNRNYYRQTDTSIVTGPWGGTYFGELTTDSNAKITSFTPKLPIRIPDAQDVVDLTSSQTISGSKTFSGYNYFDHETILQETSGVGGRYKIKATAYEQGVENNTVVFGGTRIMDKNNTEIGSMTNIATDNYIEGTMYVKQPVAGSSNATSVGVRYYKDGTIQTYAPSSAFINSIVTTAGISKASNGYVKLGNGIIIQWGTNIEAGSMTSVTLPTPFTSTNYSVVCNALLNQGSLYAFGIHYKTTTSFSIRADGGAAGTIKNYIAIGY